MSSSSSASSSASSSSSSSSSLPTLRATSTTQATANTAELNSSVDDSLRTVCKAYKTCSDSCHRLRYRVNLNESCRVNDILPPNLRMALSPTNYPSWVSPILVSEANAQEQAIHQEYLRAVQAVRSNLLINSLTEAENMMSLWSTPEYVHTALLQAGMHASDLQFAETIDKFQQFHTAQALRQDRLAERLSSKSNKRQRVNSNEASDTEMTQGDHVHSLPPQPKIVRAKSPTRAILPPIANAQHSSMAKQLQALAVSVKELEQQFRGTFIGVKRATTPSPQRTRSSLKHLSPLPSVPTAPFPYLHSAPLPPTQSIQQGTFPTTFPGYQHWPQGPAFHQHPLASQYQQPDQFNHLQPHFQPFMPTYGTQFPSYQQGPYQYPLPPVSTFRTSENRGTVIDPRRVRNNLGSKEQRLRFNTNKNGANAPI